MGSNTGKKNENAYKATAQGTQAASDAAVATAAAPDSLEADQRNQAHEFFNWQTGKSGPIDVRNMPGGGVDMALYNDAKTVHDANRVGRGVSSMAGNANPNFVAALNKEQDLQRGMAASGALEQNVNNAIATNNAQMTGLGQQADQRNEFIAGLQSGNNQAAQQRYQTYLMRPQQPNFFKQLALSFAGGAGSMATKAAMA